MNIGLNAHLLSNQAGFRSAGIHSYISNLLTHLAAAAPFDWRFTAMVGKGNQNAFDGITMRRANLDTESPMRRILWEQALQPFQLNDFDLYHALAFVAPLLLTKPCVVTVYDLSFVHYPQVLSVARRLYLRLLTGVTCQRARRVLAISHSTARDLTTSLGIPANKIDVAACGYNTERFKPLTAQQVKEFKQVKNLPEQFWLFVGTLEPRKNLVTLLNAYAALPTGERLPLILGGGKGWLYDDIFDTIKRHRLEDHVILPGFIPSEELPLWYNSAQVFIYPSVFEGFGLPVLEAMACGTPVIVSDASSLPEVAGNAGLCVLPHDIDAWTNALRRALNDAEWRLQAREKGLYEAARYHWQGTAEATIKSYQRAFNEK
jgi:glycosyltransferase involved in cell wall biosynthesis